MNYLKNFNKFPQSEVVYGDDMFTPHAPTENVALANEPVDCGLQYNGLTLDDMQSNADFNRVGDTLDKAAVAAQESSELSKTTKETIKQLKELEKQTKKHLSNSLNS